MLCFDAKEFAAVVAKLRPRLRNSDRPASGPAPLLAIGAS
jgi:hypothetical protein